MVKVASYDPEVDVLYLNLKRGGRTDDSDVSDDDIIIHYEKGEVIGLTVLYAQERLRSGAAARASGEKLRGKINRKSGTRKS